MELKQIELPQLIFDSHARVYQNDTQMASILKSQIITPSSSEELLTLGKSHDRMFLMDPGIRDRSPEKIS